MRGHLGDYGAFTPRDTLNEPGRHSAPRTYFVSHSSPVQQSTKRRTTDHTPVEARSAKRQRRQSYSSPDLLGAGHVRSQLQSRQGTRAKSRSEADAQPLQSYRSSRSDRAASTSLASWVRTSESEADPLEASENKQPREDFFTNSEYHDVEKMLRPTSRTAPAESHVLASFSAQQQSADESGLPTDTNTSFVSPRSRRAQIESRPPNERRHSRPSLRSVGATSASTQVVDDSADELGEDNDMYAVTAQKASRQPSALKRPRKLHQRMQAESVSPPRLPSDAQSERISLSWFQDAVHRLGPVSNPFLAPDPSGTDKMQALVGSDSESPFQYSFNMFTCAILNKTNKAMLLYQGDCPENHGMWAYFIFKDVHHLVDAFDRYLPRNTKYMEVKSHQLQDCLRQLEARLKEKIHASDHSDKSVDRLESQDLSSRYGSETSKRVVPVSAKVHDEDVIKYESEIEPRRESRHERQQRHGFEPRTTRTTYASPTESATQARGLSRFQRICERRKPWKESLVFPQTGRNRATVEWSDLERLDDEEFLNDNIISFCLLHMQNTGPGLLLKDKVYIFNTFFHTTLTKSVKGQRGINFSAVKNWTKKVDIFKYNYVVVPINKNLHWYCAIICNIRQLRASFDGRDNETSARTIAIDDEPSSDLQSSPTLISDTANLNEKTSQLSIQDDDEAVQVLGHSKEHRNDESTREVKKRTRLSRPSYSVHEPLIITLDSLGNSHPEVTRHLKDYLKAESLDKRSMRLDQEPKGVSAKGQPGQQNLSDCGVFLIAYLMKFMNDPAKFVEAVLRHDTSFWDTMEAEKLRDSYMEQILQTYNWTHAGPAKSESKSKEAAVTMTAARNTAVDYFCKTENKAKSRAHGTTRTDATNGTVEVQIAASPEVPAENSVQSVPTKQSFPTKNENEKTLRRKEIPPSQSAIESQTHERSETVHVRRKVSDASEESCGIPTEEAQQARRADDQQADVEQKPALPARPLAQSSSKAHRDETLSPSQKRRRVAAIVPED